MIHAATLEEAEEREKYVGENTRDNSPQTGDRVARREEEKEKGEGVLTPYRSDDTSAEDRDAVIETDGEQGTEGDTSRRRMEAKNNDMFRSADPGNAHVQEEPGQSARV